MVLAIPAHVLSSLLHKGLNKLRLLLPGTLLLAQGLDHRRHQGAVTAKLTISEHDLAHYRWQTGCQAELNGFYAWLP